MLAVACVTVSRSPVSVVPCVFQAVVLVKYLFQFGFIPWNKDTPFSHNPFFPPRIIGIEQKSDFALFDLFVLFCLFIHRSVLKVRGWSR